MPSIPTNTKCAQLGCKNKRSRLNTYCVAHGGIDTVNTNDRKQFNSRYQTAQWKVLRQMQLAKQPLCECCLKNGKVVVADHVDHLFAWNHIGDEAFYKNVFQSLCSNCHSYKSGLEKQGIYRHYASGQDYTKHDYRIVISKQSAFDVT